MASSLRAQIVPVCDAQPGHEDEPWYAQLVAAPGTEGEQLVYSTRWYAREESAVDDALAWADGNHVDTIT